MIKYKRFLHVLFILFTVLMVLHTSHADSTLSANPNIRVFINGQVGTFNSPPLIVNGRTLLPLRELLVNLGVPNDEAHIQWEGSTQRVVVTYDSRKIIVKVGSSIAYLNGKEYQLEVAPIIYQGTVFLPARFVAQSLGMPVVWDESNSRILIGTISDTASRQIIVNSTEELINELGSNRKIILMPGVYDLSSVPHTSQDDKGVIWNTVDDGTELQLSNITNLTLEGTQNGITQIITTPRYANVFSFTGCQNIIMKNVYVGHTPSEYKCDAGVLYFENCSDITIENCDLYGCGSIGIETLFAKRLSCIDTRIYYCSFKALLIENSESIHFTGCQITENHAYTDIIYLDHSKNISLTRCDISKNNWFCMSLITAVNDSDLSVTDCKIVDNYQPEGSADEWGPAYFFKTFNTYDNSSGLINFKDTVIDNNRCDYMSDVLQNTLIFENCTLRDNTWDQ